MGAGSWPAPCRAPSDGRQAGAAGAAPPRQGLHCVAAVSPDPAPHPRPTPASKPPKPAPRSRNSKGDHELRRQHVGRRARRGGRGARDGGGEAWWSSVAAGRRRRSGEPRGALPHRPPRLSQVQATIRMQYLQEFYQVRRRRGRARAHAARRAAAPPPLPLPRAARCTTRSAAPLRCCCTRADAPRPRRCRARRRCATSASRCASRAPAARSAAVSRSASRGAWTATRRRPRWSPRPSWACRRCSEAARAAAPAVAGEQATPRGRRRRGSCGPCRARAARPPPPPVQPSAPSRRPRLAAITVPNTPFSLPTPTPPCTCHRSQHPHRQSWHCNSPEPRHPFKQGHGFTCPKIGGRLAGAHAARAAAMCGIGRRLGASG
jgi:hypothetical protein